MKLLNIFKSFKNDESGAVTVDWVVLTAAIVGLGLVVINVVAPAVSDTSDSIALNLGAAPTAAADAIAGN
jgi:Flp pilus assembly pilin Flp